MWHVQRRRGVWSNCLNCLKYRNRGSEPGVALAKPRSGPLGYMLPWKHTTCPYAATKNPASGLLVY